MNNAAKALGGTVKLLDAVRFEKGEGHREEAGELCRGDRQAGEVDPRIVRRSGPRIGLMI